MVARDDTTHPPIERGLIRMAAARGDIDTSRKLLYAVMKPRGGTFSAAQLETYARWLELPGSKGVRIEAVEAEAGALVVRDDTPLDQRVAAAGLLWRGRAGNDANLRAVSMLLAPRLAPELHRAAVAAAGRIGGERA